MAYEPFHDIFESDTNIDYPSSESDCEVILTKEVEGLSIVEKREIKKSGDVKLVETDQILVSRLSVYKFLPAIYNKFKDMDSSTFIRDPRVFVCDKSLDKYYFDDDVATNILDVGPIYDRIQVDEIKKFIKRHKNINLRLDFTMEESNPRIMEIFDFKHLFASIEFLFSVHQPDFNCILDMCPPSSGIKLYAYYESQFPKHSLPMERIYFERVNSENKTPNLVYFSNPIGAKDYQSQFYEALDFTENANIYVIRDKVDKLQANKTIFVAQVSISASHQVFYKKFKTCDVENNKFVVDDNFVKTTKEQTLQNLFFCKGAPNLLEITITNCQTQIDQTIKFIKQQNNINVKFKNVLDIEFPNDLGLIQIRGIYKSLQFSFRNLEDYLRILNNLPDNEKTNYYGVFVESSDYRKSTSENHVRQQIHQMYPRVPNMKFRKNFRVLDYFKSS